MTFHCLFQDDIKKSGRYEFYCGPDDADDADDVSPVAFYVQVRIRRGFNNLGQTTATSVMGLLVLVPVHKVFD